MRITQRRSVTAALLIAGLLAQTSTAAGQEDCRRVPPPSTISAEAQGYLRSGPHYFLAEPADTDEGWRALQADYEKAGEAYVAWALEKYEVEVVRGELGGVPVLTVVPNGQDLSRGPVLLNLHGGGYALNGGAASLYSAIPFAAALNIPVISPDYRMPPDHPFPAAVEDSVSVLSAVLETRTPEEVAVYGLSAGGGLAASTLLLAKERGLPLPAAVVMNSPWSDLSEGGDSGMVLSCLDPLLPGSNGVLEALAQLYGGSRDLSDPLISPVYGTYPSDFPPSLLLSGTRDLLLSDTVRLHRVLLDADIDADLIVYEGMWHAFWSVPEGVTMRRDVVAFLTEHLRLDHQAAMTRLAIQEAASAE
ncbi:alpha/beta hydrolase [Parvularcula maris]|uniref:Alpha/beta hydrolase n=1 Tax=Parvularcula maris TaxID=2965077 RepID=A0A9X2RIH8_9PROT|nr:alpha/beta hydrolase [Parvularcula maris]MCQ8186075.1 alpha/beta hydrolase [Parvularcula maris]